RKLAHNASLPDRDLAVFLAGTPEMEEYRRDLFWAQRYARANRDVMLKLYQDVLVKMFPQVRFEEPITCHHNYVAEEVHFGEEVHAEVVHGRSSIAAVVGLGLHSLFDGVSIAAGWHFSPSLGWIVFIGIALHKIPEGFTVASIVRAAGRGRGRSLAAATVVGAACLVGAVAVSGRPQWAGDGFALATGVTLYVAATDLVPEVNKEVGHHLALTVLAGVALYWGTELALRGLGVH
ncbi:MAG: RtcB family protein, partial [Gemmatimonadetes bacterium]|nr:RtcB family protein [Gemmatimonadota bacterium]